MIAHLAFRLFDTNYDGYIDKKEFKWMTTSAKISNRTIDIVFSVIVNPLPELRLSLVLRGATLTEMASWTIKSSSP